MKLLENRRILFFRGILKVNQQPRFKKDEDRYYKKYFVTEIVESTKWANKTLNNKIINKSPKIKDVLRIETLDGGKPKRKTRKQRKSKTRKNYRNRKNMKTKNNY